MLWRGLISGVAVIIVLHKFWKKHMDLFSGYFLVPRMVNLNLLGISKERLFLRSNLTIYLKKFNTIASFMLQISSFTFSTLTLIPHNYCSN